MMSEISEQKALRILENAGRGEVRDVVEDADEFMVEFVSAIASIYRRQRNRRDDALSGLMLMSSGTAGLRDLDMVGDVTEIVVRTVIVGCLQRMMNCTDFREEAQSILEARYECDEGDVRSAVFAALKAAPYASPAKQALRSVQQIYMREEMSKKSVAFYLAQGVAEASATNRRGNLDVGLLEHNIDLLTGCLEEKNYPGAKWAHWVAGRAPSMTM